MRLAVDFNVKGILPLAYRLMMISVLKEAVKNGDLDYFQRLYVNGAHMPKPYTFAVQFGQYTLQEDLVKTNSCRLLINSADYEFLIPLLNGLQSLHTINYKGYEMERKTIRYLKEREVHTSKIIFRTLSPVLMEDEHQKPLTPNDDNYNYHLNVIANQMVRVHLGRLLHQEIKLTPIHTNKVVIKEKYDRKHPDRNLFFTAFGGTMMLEGHPEDLNYVLNYGLGLRSSQSFGMLELMEEVR
jgi:CRISPR-associated endoribonuclease Cas6